jgi:transcriptional regulator with XRE-family HTH domain
MTTRMREVRRARGLTLEDVAARCDPRTTPQTIGRLETGMRTVSLGWLDRIAKAMDVDPHDLLLAGDTSQLKVAAILGPGGAVAPKKDSIVVPPQVSAGQVAVIVGASTGDYRVGDELWCEIIQPLNFGQALNRDVLVPRPGGRFLFGRLINRDPDKLHVLSPEAGGRQQVVPSPTWLAVARRLVRLL